MQVAEDTIYYGNFHVVKHNMNYMYIFVNSKAVDELTGKEWNGQKLYAARAQKKAERQMDLKQQFEKRKIERINRYQGVNLYVKNLDDTVDDAYLREQFSQYGTITSAKVMMDDKENSKGSVLAVWILKPILFWAVTNLISWLDKELAVSFTAIFRLITQQSSSWRA